MDSWEDQMQVWIIKSLYLFNDYWNYIIQLYRNQSQHQLIKILYKCWLSIRKCWWRWSIGSKTVTTIRHIVTFFLRSKPIYFSFVFSSRGSITCLMVKYLTYIYYLESLITERIPIIFMSKTCKYISHGMKSQPRFNRLYEIYSIQKLCNKILCKMI